MASSSSDKRKRDDESGGATKKAAGPWSQGLKAAMDDPSARVKSDDECVVIKDKYPKARVHYLVLPRKAIPNLKSLQPNHIPLLRHMEEVAKDLVREKHRDMGVNFRYGYHAIPSMSYVHLHVISQDFDSPCLKTKKHWNSFTTEYFLDSEDVIDMLEEEGKVQTNTSQYEQILKQDLECHVCNKRFTTMPALKQHLPSHIPKA